MTPSQTPNPKLQEDRDDTTSRQRRTKKRNKVHVMSFYGGITGRKAGTKLGVRLHKGVPAPHNVHHHHQPNHSSTMSNVHQNQRPQNNHVVLSPALVLFLLFFFFFFFCRRWQVRLRAALWYIRVKVVLPGLGRCRS